MRRLDFVELLVEKGAEILFPGSPRHFARIKEGARAGPQPHRSGSLI
jgi:hypothetical protein